jgi:hypothetical protein
MRRQAARLVELGPAQGERGCLQVDVAQRAHQRFGQSEAGRGDQPEQAAVGLRAKRPKPQPRRCPQHATGNRAGMGYEERLRRSWPLCKSCQNGQTLAFAGGSLPAVQFRQKFRGVAAINLMV